MEIFTSIRVLVCTLSISTISLAASVWTKWEGDPSNPIYNPYPTTIVYEDFAPCVLFDEASFHSCIDAKPYQMWHQGNDNSDGVTYPIALSSSFDGINWTLEGSTNLPVNASSPCVVYDKDGFGGGPYCYKIWYLGDSEKKSDVIHYATSVDGFEWTTPIPITEDKASCLAEDAIVEIDEDVITSIPGSIAGPSFVMYNPNPTFVKENPYTFPYVLFYDTSTFKYDEEFAQKQIALAYSVDGICWTRYDTLLTHSENHSKARVCNVRLSIVKVQDMYYMFYSDHSTTGVASSADGLYWVKDSNPIVISGQEEKKNKWISTFSVLADEGMLKMWFVERDRYAYPPKQVLGYATLDL